MVLATALAFLVLSPSQEGISKAASDAIASSFKVAGDGQYMQALSVLERAYQEGSKADKDAVGQLMATQYSFMGEEAKAMEMFDAETQAFEKPLPETIPEIDSAKQLAAIPAIVKAAKGRQIVILNEAHHVPRCRGFALLLASELKKSGFAYFAAETFAPGFVAEWKKGYPSQKIGYYSKEPAFGDLIRQAMKLDYKGIHYETENFSREGDSFDGINRREIAEANFLVERLFKKDPKARVFIYCGYSHATEDSRKLDDGRELSWMAARLKKLTGIDPLTVDQTEEIPHSAEKFERPEYRYVMGKLAPKEPVVFAAKSGGFEVFGSWKGRVDMQVFHPRDALIAGRPSWLAMGGYRKPLLMKVSAKEKTLLQAFVASEPAEAIPVDQVLVQQGEATPTLMLPKGKYQIFLQVASGEKVLLQAIEVR